MAKLLKRSGGGSKDPLEAQIEEEAASETPLTEREFIPTGNFDYCISTGSTLLDLAISGTKVHGGGIPGGVLIEIYGPSGVGKTACLAEIAARVQKNGGSIHFMDPEARLDKEYMRIYGAEIDKKNYSMPDTVEEVFDFISTWKPSMSNPPNAVLADSLAALSTALEMEKGDKMGQRRAKMFSQGMRVLCRTITKSNMILACSNQIRQGEYGITTPGGFAIPFYASIRIQLGFSKPRDITKTVTFKGKSHEQIVGVNTIARVVKNSTDIPYREAYLPLIFRYGFDDIRANLQFVKNIEGGSVYKAVDREYQAMNDAIYHIEKAGLEKPLKDTTISLWLQLQEKFKVERKRKL